MLYHLFNWINQVTFLGIREDDSYITKFRKRVLNRTFFIVALTAMIFILEGILFEKRNVIIVPLFFIAIAIVLLIFNSYKHFQISFYVLSFLFPTMFLGVSVLYGDALKMDYTISFFIVLVLTLYDDKWTRIINIVYLIFLQTFSLYYTNNHKSFFSEYVDSFDSLVVLTATTLGLFILVYQFIRESKNFQNRQKTLNLDLDKKNKELQHIIVEKERLNRELLERTDDLQRANDFLESYTYITSHDLKTPVRNINSFSDLLSKKLRNLDDEDVKDYLGFIKSGALQMDGILNGIIENAQSNRSSLELEGINCNELIQEIKSQIKNHLEDINGKVSPTDLPNVRADKMMLKKVFFNLIDNGLKYNENAQPSVAISYRQIDGFYEFSVVDNGIGIPEQYSEAIFKMFKKLHGTNEFSGSGVGLALCKKIIELHDGKIWLTTSEASGSTFKFTLPKSPPIKA